MKYSEWIEQLKPHMTPKGARLDLRMYVYPDGHGNIILRHGDNAGQPVNDMDEAIRVFQDLWQKVSAAQVESGSDETSALSQMVERITPENRHDEVSFGDPVGNELW